MALPILGRMLIATAELAGGLGVPYLAPVVSLIQQIQAACKSVIFHKVGTHQPALIFEPK